MDIILQVYAKQKQVPTQWPWYLSLLYVKMNRAFLNSVDKYAKSGDPNCNGLSSINLEDLATLTFDLETSERSANN